MIHHQIPMRARAKPVALALNDEQRRHLAEIVRRPGYEVLLKMMEIPCVLQDAKLVNTPAGEEAHVLAEHRIAQAMWEFFATVQRQVEFEVNEIYKEPEAPPAAEDDVRM